jgi:hypothetical protein
MELNPKIVGWARYYHTAVSYRLWFVTLMWNDNDDDALLVRAPFFIHISVQVRYCMILVMGLVGDSAARTSQSG